MSKTFDPLLTTLCVLPAFALLFISPVAESIDLSLSSYFYEPVHQTFSHSYPLKLIYHLGPFPALLTAFFSLLGLAASFFYPSLIKHRPSFLSLSLTLIIGSGLIINAGLKEYWQRPRPKQIEAFGGSQNYQNFYLPNLQETPEPFRSFPSGHASMGFYFLSLALVARRYNHKPLLYAALFLTYTLGPLLSFTRIAQGGHFFSDVLASAAIMGLVALIIDTTLYKRL